MDDAMNEEHLYSSSISKQKKRSVPAHRNDEDDCDDAKERKEEQLLEQQCQPQQSNKFRYRPMNFYGEHKRAVSSVKLAPFRLCKNRSGAALAASASADGTCKIWDLSGGQQPPHSLNANYDANDMTASASASAQQQQTADPSSASLSAGNTNSNKSSSKNKRHAMPPIATCVGHSRGINEVSWNPVSPLLATASDDKTVRLWDAVTAEAVGELRGHDNFVFCVDQHNATICTGSFDETVKLWDVRTGECVCTLPAHSDPVTAVSFNRDGTTVATASHDGLVRIWDVATGECLKTVYAAGNPPVSSIQYAPNGKYLLAGTLDSTLRLWPVTVSGAAAAASSHNNCCAKTYRDVSGKKHFVNTKYSIAADFTCAGDVVVGSETGDVVIFNLQTGTIQQVLRGHEDAVLAVSAHDRLPILATGAMTADRKVEFWSQRAPDHDDGDDDEAVSNSSNAPPSPPSKKSNKRRSS